jgi:hypothetical protein
MLRPSDDVQLVKGQYGGKVEQRCCLHLESAASLWGLKQMTNPFYYNPTK